MKVILFCVGAATAMLFFLLFHYVREHEKISFIVAWVGCGLYGQIKDFVRAAWGKKS